MIKINHVDELSVAPFDVIEKSIDGDWRKGKEIRQITIIHRSYQTSSNSTQARFSKDVTGPFRQLSYKFIQYIILKMRSVFYTYKGRK